MSMQKVKLGGYIDAEVKKVNDNFAEIEADYTKKSELPTVPTKVSDLTNDSGYQTADQVQNTVDAALGTVEGELPTDLGDLTNNAGYIKSTDQNFINKVDKEDGKGLSTNDYDNAAANKVAKLGKIDFTTSNFTQNSSDNNYYANLEGAEKYPVKVMRTNGSNAEEVIVGIRVTNTEITIISDEAFSGYVVTM